MWQDSDGAVDVLVGAVGTGGSISGTGRYLKAQKPGLQVVVAEPSPESVPSAEHPYAETIEGVHKVTEVDPKGLPANYDAGVVDATVAVSLAEARAAAQDLAREEGLLAGTSGGAVLAAALAVARRPDSVGKTFVLVVADSGERYLSPPVVPAPREAALAAAQ
ncbi:hypothetical protein BKE38_03990 [Pseudoroseomonas deserti]|uniref:Tryptophan synthase beta chain-like PALP domain-containing protein n=1 Tax=Teichococcus deserti TaxID=1817963 RepID=A0A1V2H7T0_9PROT|nr:hypothetical protein BKE38_03990 [Pseudoroseomonas deserti]